jgi:uncharacterized protein
LKTSLKKELAVENSEADFESANQYALERLTRDLSPSLHYHNLAHTRDEVIPAAERLARLEGVRRSTCRLLITACYFHDIGFIESQVEHEASGARMAGEVLPQYGYNSHEIAIIQGCILVTKVFTQPSSLIEAIIVDADLAVLGRSDFLRRGFDLRRELSELGEPFSDEAWFSAQYNFLSLHHYRTISAQSLLGPKKRENMHALTLLLGQRAPL